MDGASEVGTEAGTDPAGAVGGAILDRLDAIGRLLAQGAPPHPRASEVEAHLVNRIDMLGRIVESLLADRDADEARLLALARRVVDLESTLLPAVAACTERLDAALPLLAGLAAEGDPAGPALALVLRDLRDAVTRLDRAPGVLSGSGPGGPQAHAAEAIRADAMERDERGLAPSIDTAEPGIADTNSPPTRPAPPSFDAEPEAAPRSDPVVLGTASATALGAADSPEPLDATETEAMREGAPATSHGGPHAPSGPLSTHDKAEGGAAPLDEETERIHDALARALGATP